MSKVKQQIGYALMAIVVASAIFYTMMSILVTIYNN